MAQLITFPRKDKRRHTILMVDHDPVVRELLCSALNEAGFNAFAIPSADEAARMLDRGIFSIDLVFCDADVPGILPFTGRDVTIDGDRKRGCDEPGQAGQRGKLEKSHAVEPATVKGAHGGGTEPRAGRCPR